MTASLRLRIPANVLRLSARDRLRAEILTSETGAQVIEDPQKARPSVLELSRQRADAHIREVAETRGFPARIEKPILDGAGRVDISLALPDRRVAEAPGLSRPGIRFSHVSSAKSSSRPTGSVGAKW